MSFALSGIVKNVMKNRNTRFEVDEVTDVQFPPNNNNKMMKFNFEKSGDPLPLRPRGGARHGRQGGEAGGGEGGGKRAVDGRALPGLFVSFVCLC